MATQPWIRQHLSTDESAERTGASCETVRGMIRDGLIEAHKRASRWRIPVAELEHWEN